MKLKIFAALLSLIILTPGAALPQLFTLPLMGAGCASSACGSGGGGGYTGPGNVTGWNAAYGYWGLRAYTTAQIGGALVDVCSTAASTCSGPATINSAANGYIDTAAITALGYSPVYVNKIYDQAGSQPLVFNVGARPELQTNKVGGLLAMLFSGSQLLSTGSNGTAQTQPLTVSAISEFTGTGLVFTDGSFSFQPLGSVFANDRYQADGGSRIDYTGTDNIFEAIHSVNNGSSSSMSINGTITSAGDPGSNGILGANKLTIGAIDSGGAPFSGYVFEVLVKAGAVSTTNQALLTTNQRAIGTGF
jgi:hypothetical protein